MKLIVNYDVINEIKNANEGYTPFKIIRNNKLNISICIALNYLTHVGSMETFMNCTTALIGATGGILLINYGVLPIVNDTKDIYKDKAIKNLQKLNKNLNDSFIKTDYDLLLESKLYHKKTRLQINENKIPELTQEKYILIPSYDYNGNITETSILQEHTVGTDEYILSLGTPKKQLKLAYSMG